MRHKAPPGPDPGRRRPARAAAAWLLAGACLLLGSAGCKPRAAVVRRIAAERAPPYGFFDLTNRLDAVALSADGQRGWAVGPSGVILRSVDGGGSWRRVPGVPMRSQFGAVTFLADGQRGWAVGAYGAILRSADAGQSWQRVASVAPESYLRAIAFAADGQRGLAAGTGGTILRTTDGGKGWARAAGAAKTANIQSVAISQDGGRAWATTDDGTILRSADGGQTWRGAAGIVRDEAIQGVAFSADGARGLAVGDYGIVYRSTDGGATWQRVAGIDTEAWLQSVAVSADGARACAVGDYGTILRTTDGGLTWREVAGEGVPTDQMLRSVAFASDGLHGCAAGDYGEILRTTDGGLTWREVAGPPTEQVLRSVAFEADGVRGWAVGAHGTILHSVDGGSTWRSAAGAPSTAGLHAVAFAADAPNGCAVGAGGTILRNADGGETWQKVDHVPATARLDAVALSSDGTRGWAVGAGGTVVRSADGGKSWMKTADVPAAVELESVAFTPDGSRGWAVGEKGTIVRTMDGGKVWKRVPGVPTGADLHAVAMSSDGASGWAVGAGVILRTTDGGKSWEKTASGLTVGLNSTAISPDGRRGWMVGDKGVIWRTIDGGQYWWIVALDATQGALNSVFVSSDGKRAWAVGGNGTILQTSMEPTDMPLFDAEVTHDLDEQGGSTIVPVIRITGPSALDRLNVHLVLEGPNATGDLAKGLARDFVYGEPIAGWSERELGPGLYTCHVEVCDGWNVATGEFQFGNGAWARFAGFMGWTSPPSAFLSFAKDYGTQNMALLVCLYCLGVVGLFAFRPYWFVLWHERVAPVVAALPIPTKAAETVSQLGGLFLLTRPRCLDAVVAAYAPAALAELEKLPEVGSRPKWVAAPLQVEDEVFGTPVRPFAEPADWKPGDLYIRGLTELSRHLIRRRWWLSIEGPGGLGKSALAFQMVRWFAAPEAQSRLRLPQAIPVYVRTLNEGLDKEVVDELKRILDLPGISAKLTDALLGQRRVLALVDGISEKVADLKELTAEQLNPAKGAVLTHFLVVTSRRRMQLPDVVKVLPRPVDLGNIDAVLNRYLDDVVGAGRFDAAQRESIRESLKGIMKELSGGGREPQIPMVFVKLLIQRADEVFAKNEAAAAPISAEATLPRDLAELVDAYLANLFESRPDGVEEANRARRAALACIGRDGVPQWRPLAAYDARSVTRDEVEGLVNSGLMIKDGADVGDPRYKFSLDPIAEYLAAKELVMAVRDSRLTLGALKAETAGFSAESDVAKQIVRIGRALGVGLE